MHDHSPDPLPDGRVRLTRRRLLEVGAAAGAALALPGGLAEAAFAAGPKKGGSATLAMNDGGPSETLNPFQLPLFMEAVRAQITHDSLFGPVLTNAYEPKLALSAEPARGALAWKVTLRPDVTFHNGKPLTPEDVIYTYQYALNPKNKAQVRTNLDALDPHGISKDGKNAVLFRLKRPIGDFRTYVAGGFAWIVPAGTTKFDTIVGTGPFKLESWSPGQRTVLTRNDNYWGHVYLDQLTMVPIPDPGQRINALLTGTADAIMFVDTAQAKAQRNNTKIKLVTATLGAVFAPPYVQMDVKPFDDNRVRTALKLSVDRNQMLDNVLLGFGSLGNDVAGKGFPSYNTSLPQHHYDPEKAKSLLKAAGQENLSFTLYTSSAITGLLESATAWKAQAKKAGITINLVKLPADSYWSNDKYLKVPVYQTNWGGSFESWAPQALFRGASYNETHWNDPKWENDFRKAQSITDDKKRNAAYRALEVPVWANGGYVIWGFQANITAVSSKIQGAKPTPSFNVRPQDWWIG
jgi:peptide/nickel transport system substrate-binding protein